MYPTGIQKTKRLILRSTLESNVDAISRTPKLHQTELKKHTHQPSLIGLQYEPIGGQNFGPNLVLLETVYLKYDIEKDPWIMKMQSGKTTRRSPALWKARAGKKT